MSARRLDALVALSRDTGATMAERALAASHAARLLTASGVDYLTVYPLGLPVVDALDGVDEYGTDDDADATERFRRLVYACNTWRNATYECDCDDVVSRADEYRAEFH